MHYVVQAILLQVIFGTLGAPLLPNSENSSYRLIVNLPSTSERGELLLIEGQDPLVAIRNFAHAHSLGLDAKEHLSDHLCSVSFINCRYPRLLSHATAYDSLAHKFDARNFDAQDSNAMSTLPFINTGGRWETNPAIAAALAIAVTRITTRQRVISSSMLMPSPFLGIDVGLVNDRDDYRWRASLTMLHMAVGGMGSHHSFRFVGQLDFGHGNLTH